MAWNQQQHAVLLEEQRDVARNSTETALEKAAEADRVTRFMINTLGSAHPNRDGRNVTVAERLADGLRELGKSFPEGTTDKAALLRTIGKTYEGLGLYQEALDPLKTAWQLYSKTMGEVSGEALETENEYGDLLTKLGRYEEAEGHLQHARDGLITLMGQDSEPAIRAENNLAHNLFDQGRRAQALEMFAGNYARARASISLNNSTTIATLLAYANALKSAGSYAESRALINPVLPIAEENFGGTHLLVIGLKSASASIDRVDGKYALALDKFVDIHDQLADKLGEEHIRTINSLSDVAIVHGDMGEHAKAKKIMDLIVERLSRVLGENHPETIRAILNVARTLQENERKNEARTLLRDAYRQASDVLGSDDATTMMLATHYGGSLAENNQFVEAERLLTDAVEFFRDEEFVDPITRAESFADLADLYSRTERQEQAVALHETALEIVSGAFGDGNPKTLTAKNNLAGAYHALDQINDAIRLYDEVLVGLRKTLGSKHLHTLITGLNLAITYRDNDRSQDAIKVLADIVPVFDRVVPGTWLAHTARFQLGRAYLDAGSVDLANRELETAFAGFETLMSQQPAAEKIGLANQMRRMIQQFESLGDTTAAESWRQRRGALLVAQGFSPDDE
jgi:tetratricopeptide (TPR) repeat protein